MLIAVDIDQVLADTLKSYLPYHNKKYKTNFSADDCYSLAWWDVFGITEKEFVKDYDQFCGEGRIDEISPINGAKEGIFKLAQKHKLIAVTARPFSLADKTEMWLEKHFPGIFKNTYYTRKSTLGDEDESKYSICLRAGAEILIDDCFEFAETCAINGMKVLLYDWPWNRDRKLPVFIERVYSWKDILNIINKI